MIWGVRHRRKDAAQQGTGGEWTDVEETRDGGELDSH